MPTTGETTDEASSGKLSHIGKQFYLELFLSQQDPKSISTINISINKRTIIAGCPSRRKYQLKSVSFRKKLNDDDDDDENGDDDDYDDGIKYFNERIKISRLNE